MKNQYVNLGNPDILFIREGDTLLINIDFDHELNDELDKHLVNGVIYK